MKSFKIRENLIRIDGVLYGPTPTEVKIMGKAGMIQSISVPNRGQYFPYSGTFIDSTLPVTEDSTGIVEDVKPVKKARKSK
jgi:hypothetical protein